MSQAEEKFMEDRSKMTSCITEFYNSCHAIGVDNEGFAEDVIAAINEATNGAVAFDEWYE